jgi:uncharacterized protein with HEPN domain
MPRDDSTLLDLQKSARLAAEFLGDLDLPAFMSDAKTQSAVLHQLLLLGEGVKRLSQEFREANASIPWRLMAGMRDNLIHEYDTVDIEQVYETVRRDVPKLMNFLTSVVPKL